MSIVAIVPVANMKAANDALAGVGANNPNRFGSNNFSVPAYGSTGVTHAALHSWDDPAFLAALKALPNVVVDDGTRPQGQPPASLDPITRTKELIEAQGAKWGAQAPMLPTTGNATAGTLYAYDRNGTREIWYCIQTFSRSTYGAVPDTYPALIRRIRVPGTVAAWVQPIDQYDAYKLVNPFTGKPDECTFGGFTWYVSQADGSGNNVWQPGVFGWTKR